MFPIVARSEGIDNILDMFDADWVRYAANNWLVWTHRTPEELYTVLKPHLFQDEHILVVPIDVTQKNGYLSQWLWEWMEQKLRNPEVTMTEILNQLALPNSSGP
jgi:hypothetical protein